MPKFHLHVPIERVYVLVDKGNLSFARDDDDGGVGVVITQSESVSVCEMKRLLDKSSSTAPDARHHFCLGASPPFREREGPRFLLFCCCQLITGCPGRVKTTLLCSGQDSSKIGANAKFSECFKRCFSWATISMV